MKMNIEDRTKLVAILENAVKTIKDDPEEDDAVFEVLMEEIENDYSVSDAVHEFNWNIYNYGLMLIGYGFTKYLYSKGFDDDDINDVLIEEIPKLVNLKTN